MPIEIVAYTSEYRERVIAFNRRLSEGETGWGWYEEPEDEWLPRRPDVPVWREHFLAVEDRGAVRGAYALKPQPWRIDGQAGVEMQTVTDWQGPVSEGLLSAKYAPLGLRMIRDMLKKYPLLYSWGHGGEEGKMLQLLRSLKWQIHPTPFLFKVCRPYAFLRQSAYLRTSPGRRFALDALAVSGLGWLGLKLLFGTLSVLAKLGLRGAPRAQAAQAELFEAFGDWADELWERCAPAYSAIGLRDARTMNALLPRDGWPPAQRLRVSRAGETIGWVTVMDRQLENDARFGSMRVGSIIDCLALPEDAPSVIRAGAEFLEQRGVDLIASNQAHPDWARAFEANGFLALPGRRYFAMSPALFAALAPFEEVSRGLHMTNLDGHGPHGF